jgi:phosphatidylinositol-3-phosphatase
MIPLLPPTRLSRLQLAVVASLSALATAAVIATALGRTPAQSAAIAALRNPPVTVRISSPTPAAAPMSTLAANTPPAASPDASPSSLAPAASSSAPSAAGSSTTGTATAQVGSTTAPGGAPSAATNTPKIGHLFVIALSTPSYDAAFGPRSVARFLNGTLRREGTLLGGYETLGGNELPDYLAMISGQAPNPDTSSGCATYAEFASGAKPPPDGQLSGAGCVYPNTVLTIGDQATAAGHTWKAYIGDMGKSTCAHPNSNAVDDAPPPGATNQYDTRHNPFIYFHSLLDLGSCASNDVSLDHLPGDLRSPTGTPSYAFIAPGACVDASGQTCPDGQRAGLAGEDAFLQRWVPKIRRSAAYKRDGLLIVAFALSATDSPGAIPSTNTRVPTGALVLSPHTPHGKTISATYNAYSLLRSVEDLLGYKPLARAQSAKSFIKDVLPSVVSRK